jgi:hypothetical protein
MCNIGVSYVYRMNFYYRLKEFLRERLIASGWRDELKEACKEVIRKKGLDKITIEELVAEITPKGRGTTSSIQIHRN